MKQVLKVSDLEQTETKKLKPIEFTHYLHSSNGWVENDFPMSGHNPIIYLGKCETDGDMFASYRDNCIRIFKGHLNDGVY